MDKEIERIAEALTKGESIADFVPKSKSEAYLKSALMKQKIDDLPTPASRLDVLLCLLNDNVHKLYDAKFDDGYSEGYDAGLAVNYDVGYSEGYAAGNTAGNATGHEAGVKDGYISGHADGYTEGFTSGRETGNEEGHEEGYSEGLEAGKQAEYDRFWDVFQNYGKRTFYYQGFAGQGWNKDTFKPKYDIVPKTQAVYGMFSYFNYFYEAFDLVEHLEGLEINIDFSGATDTNYLFQSASVSRIGVVDITGCSQIANTFTKCSAVTIDKFIIKNDGSQAIYSPFSGCTNLENIVIEGKFGKSISFSNSTKLTVASAKSIINALKNYAGTSSELTNKLTLPATVWDNLEASESAPNGGTWKDYVLTLGWQTA